MNNPIVIKDGEIYRIICGCDVIEVYDAEALSDTLNALRKIPE